MSISLLKFIVDSVKDSIDNYKAAGKDEALNYYFGMRFEEWVVCWSNIEVGGKNKAKKRAENKPIKKGYWILKDWRGDKKCELNKYKGENYYIMPKSSSAPDLTLEKTKPDEDKKSIWNEGELIFVECKWTSSGLVFSRVKSGAEEDLGIM